MSFLNICNLKYEETKRYYNLFRNIGFEIYKDKVCSKWHLYYYVTKDLKLVVRCFNHSNKLLLKKGEHFIQFTREVEGAVGRFDNFEHFLSFLTDKQKEVLFYHLDLFMDYGP